MTSNMCSNNFCDILKKLPLKHHFKLYFKEIEVPSCVGVFSKYVIDGLHLLCQFLVSYACFNVCYTLSRNSNGPSYQHVRTSMIANLRFLL